jgi:hypothetical protein
VKDSGGVFKILSSVDWDHAHNGYDKENSELSKHDNHMDADP